ncbi:MAG TPA: hypothetical protein PKA99_08515 [Dermatophilaceae bacterium]|nr:hypothetical protein [Dermatophilaceae bacterium]
MTTWGWVRAAALVALHGPLLALASIGCLLVPAVLWRPDLVVPGLSVASLAALGLLPPYAAHRILEVARRNGGLSTPPPDQLRRLSEHATTRLHEAVLPTDPPTWYVAARALGRPVVVTGLGCSFAVLDPAQPGSTGPQDVASRPVAGTSPELWDDMTRGTAPGLTLLGVLAWWLRSWIDMSRWLLSVWSLRPGPSIETRIVLLPCIVFLPLTATAGALAYLATWVSLTLTGAPRAHAIARMCATHDGHPQEVTDLADSDDRRVGWSSSRDIAPLTRRRLAGPGGQSSASHPAEPSRARLPLALAAAFSPFVRWSQLATAVLFAASVAVLVAATGGTARYAGSALCALGALFTTALPARMTVHRELHEQEERRQRVVVAVGPQDDTAAMSARVTAAAQRRRSCAGQVVALWPTWGVIALTSGLFGAWLGPVVGQWFAGKPGHDAGLIVGPVVLAVVQMGYVVYRVFVRRDTSFVDRVQRSIEDFDSPSQP